MDTIYSQRTGANPVSFSQNYNNPMINAPRQGANTGNIQDYLRGYNGIPQNILDMTSPMSQPQPQPQQPVEQPQQAPNQLTPDGLQRLQGLIGSSQGNVQAMQGQQPLQSNGGLSGVDIGDPSQPNEDGMMQGLDMSNPLPISAPKEISQNPTDDVKTYSPENVQAGINGLNIGMQSRTSNSPMASQSQQIDQGRMNQDLTAISQAKDPKKAWQEIKKDPFYKDSNFYTGMMNVGLAIMSGANPMQAFQAGSQAMTQADMKDQLRGNRDALLQTYTPDSVANAIAQGNPQLLQQRKMSDEDRMAAEQNVWQARADITDARQAARDDRVDQRQSAREAASDARLDKRYQLMGDLANQRQQLQVSTPAKLTAGYQPMEEFGGISTNARRQLQTSYRPVINVISQRNKWMAPVEASLDELANAKDVDSSKAAQRATVENLTKLIQGGLASIGRHTMDELTGDPSWLANTTNKLSMMAGQPPTEANKKWLMSLGNMIQKIDKGATVRQVGPLVDSLMTDSKLPLDNALRAANSVFAAGGVRMTEDDYHNWAKGHSKVYKQNIKSGALSDPTSSSKSDDSWMYN